MCCSVILSLLFCTLAPCTLRGPKKVTYVFKYKITVVPINKQHKKQTAADADALQYQYLTHKKKRIGKSLLLGQHLTMISFN